MKIEGITDVFFDLDHTLWDFDKNSALTFKKIFNLNNISINIDEFLSSYKPINLKYWRLYRENKIDKTSLRFKRLNEAFMAIDFDVEPQMVDKLSDDYIIHLTTFNHVFDGTFQILDYLNTNYDLHIITNGFDEVQHKKLTESNINHYFKTVTNSEMVGVKKPNPKIFDYALKQARTKTESSIMVGDSLEADIYGAKNFGMEAIFFDVKDTIVESNIKQINKLLDLKRYL
jgi:putative hydrolase of the HAD superfamily